MIIRLLVRFRYYAAAVMLLLCCIKQTYAQASFELEDNQKRASFNFKLLRDMIIVPLKINGKGPYNFILDSGVGIMIITEPKLMDSLTITSKRLIKISGLGNNADYDAYVTSALDISMPDGIRGKNVSAAIFTKDHFGISNYAGMPVYGLLGYDFFNSFAVKINFEDSTLTVGAPKDIRIFKRGGKLPLIIEDRKSYLKAHVVLPDGGPILAKLVVDLGAGHALSVENLIAKNKGLPDKFISANLGMGLTGPISGYMSRTKEIELGKYKLKDVITSFPDSVIKKDDTPSVKRDGNLGLGILKRFNLIIDYPDQLIYFKPNFLYRTPFEHDMSGIEYFAGGDNLKHIIVARVEKGSAADDIGLVKGDEIMRINFKSVEDMNIEDIDNIFKSRSDRSILLEVFRNGVYDRLILTLKRRI